MTRPPSHTDRRVTPLERTLPDGAGRRILLGVAGAVASLVAGTYGINFVLGPLNLGVLEFVWGVVLALTGVGGLLGSVAILVPAVTTFLATTDEPPTDDETASIPDGDPVETLKRRYADGEIGDEEFERRLDRLLSADDGARTDEHDATLDRSRERDPASSH
jgi:uncharacterized membrane protein